MLWRITLGLAAFFIALTLMWSLQTAAEASSYRLCIGEYEKNCPQPHDVFATCYADPDVVADNTCAITVQGSRTAVPHRLIRQSSQSGNRCGYEIYLIECQDK